MKKLSLFLAIALILTLSAFAYENPGQCCGDVYGTVNVLCFPCDSKDYSSNEFNISKQYIVNAVAEAGKLHYHGGDFFFYNPDDLGGSGGYLGGTGRTSYRSYQNLWSGFNLGGNSLYNRTILPYKFMGVSTQSGGGLGQSTQEYEIIMDRRYLVTHLSIKCADADSCDTPNSDSIRFSLAYLQGTPTAYNVTDIDGSYCGVRFNMSDTSSYDKAMVNRSFIAAFSICPQVINQSGTTVYAYLNMTYNIPTNLTIVYTTIEFEENISDWMLNYTLKENAIRSEYENMTKELYFPVGQNTANVSNYYWSAFTLPQTTFKCWDDSDEACNFIIGGNSYEIVIPNTENYYGMWPWDAPNTFNNLIPAINWSSSERYFRNLMEGSLHVLVNNSNKWPSNQSFTPIYTYANGTSQIGEEWAITALNMYNFGLVNATYLCNEFFPVLRSEWHYIEKTYRGANWRCNIGGGSTGRDSTDIQPANYDNVQCTTLFAIGAKALAQISGICSDAAGVTYYNSAFQNITTDAAAFYNTTAGMPWTLVGDTTYFYQENNAATGDAKQASWASEPMGDCLYMAIFNASAAQTVSILTNLNINFTGPYGLTSIPTQHACYTPRGTDGACDGGETWDGPTWAGVDDAYCYDALLYRKNNLSDSTVQSNITWISDLAKKTYSDANTPWGTESYDSSDATVNDAGLWGSNPYGWGDYLLHVMNSYPVLSVFNFTGGAVTTSDTTAPSISNVENISITGSGCTVTFDVTDTTSVNCSVNAGITADEGTLFYGGVGVYSIPLSGFGAGTQIFYNVSCSDTSANLGQVGTYNFTTLTGYTSTTHPYWSRNASVILANINDSTIYRSRWLALKSDSDSYGTFSGYCTLNSLNSCYWRGSRVLIEALRWYLDGDATSYSNALSGLTGWKNFSAANYTSKGVLEVAQILTATAYAYDIMAPSMTEEQRSGYVNKTYAILTAIMDDSSSNGFNGYDLKVSNDNGHAKRAAICTDMLSIFGEYGPDQNFTSGGRFQKCKDAAEMYIRGYFNGTSEQDGYHYWDYGISDWLPFVMAYRTFGNASYLQEYNATLSNLGKDMLRYTADENEGYGGNLRRRLFYSESYPFGTVQPLVMASLAQMYNDGSVQWGLLRNNNWTTTYASYGTTNPIDLFWFNASVAAVHPNGVLSNEWIDSHYNRLIWRSGYNFTTDLIFSFGGYGEQSYGHPNQDGNSVLLNYKYPLLSTGGYRNGTSEIPKGVKYKNTLVVDGLDNFGWGDAFITNPATLHYAGPTSGTFLSPTTCTVSNFAACSIISRAYASYFQTYSTSASYDEVMGVKPYYGIYNYTRRIVYDKDDGKKFFVEKVDVLDDTAHVYAINYNTETIDIQVNGNNMTVARNDSNLQLLKMYSSASCSWTANKEQYGILSYNRNLVLNSLNCTNTTNLTVIVAWMPYLDSESPQLSFSEDDNSTHYVVDVYNSTSLYRKVSFSKTNLDAPARVEQVGNLDVCGNGVKQDSEECDGTDFNSLTCTDYGYNTGSLACTGLCYIDSSDCHNVSTCGDGVRDPDEQCDGTQYGGLTCSSYGYISGSLACVSCVISVSNCINPDSPSYGTRVLYDVENLTNANDPYEQAVALNAITGGLVGIAIILVALIITLLVVYQNTGDAIAAFGAGSFFAALAASILLPLQLVSWNNYEVIVLICAISVALSLLLGRRSG